MAISTNDEKLSIIDFAKPWAGGMPITETSPFAAKDKLQILRLYPGDYDFTVTADPVLQPLRRPDESIAQLRRVNASSNPLRRPDETITQRQRADIAAASPLWRPNEDVTQRRRPPAHPTETVE